MDLLKSHSKYGSARTLGRQPPSWQKTGPTSHKFVTLEKSREKPSDCFELQFPPKSNCNDCPKAAPWRLCRVWVMESSGVGSSPVGQIWV